MSSDELLKSILILKWKFKESALYVQPSVRTAFRHSDSVLHLRKLRHLRGLGLSGVLSRVTPEADGFTSHQF
jgi:hypothetical protein